MLRYVPILITRAGRLVLCVRPELAGIIRQAYGSRVTLTLQGIEDATTYDRYAWMMSLPALIGELPVFTPLASVKTRQRSASSEPRADIGVCWSGDPAWVDDGERSLRIDLLSPLLVREDRRWFSLQTGPAANTITEGVPIIRPVSPLLAFAQTAALIARLDAVLTVDTAVAHLAGAMGVPTWVLLTADADPRWGIGGTTSWYPSMRLIRQRAVGDWTDALLAVEAELETCARQVAAV
jgi:hypothetical protein